MASSVMNGNGDAALVRLLSTLQSKGEQLVDSEEDLTFLRSVLGSKELNALVHVHDKILNVAGIKEADILSSGSKPTSNVEELLPTLSNSCQVLEEVLDMLPSYIKKSPGNKDAQLLLKKLQDPFVQSLLAVHDAVAQKDFVPKLPEIPIEVDEDEETIKIVQLVKSNEPLGATIKSDENTGKIVIARVMHGGAADRSGLIHPGDQVIEVNGILVEGKTPGDVLKILQAAEGTIVFKLVPADNKSYGRESKVRVRAHFDFVAALDRYIPCKEAGLDFRKGDILHIVNQDDPYWWQARKEGDTNMRAGLIPSRALQERRIIYERAQLAKNEDTLCSSLNPCPNSPSHSPCALPHAGQRTKKILYTMAEQDDFDREDIATYEEVAKLYPRPGMPRPIVLIGPPAVGRNELKRRLIAMEPEKFKTTIPYTSRSKKAGEIDGLDYHFISREQMEADINNGKFIEFGEYKGNLYGTSIESVVSFVNAGLVCVLNPHYQALKALRTQLLKPYIIFVKPPPFEELKETRSAAYARSTFDENNSRGFTDDEYRDIITNAERIEFLYGHWFDETIVNGDLSEAFEQLLAAVHRIETEPLWVPASWVV